MLYLGCARIFQLFYVETRWMWKIGRSKQSRLLSTGKRISSTMKFLQRAIITLRSPSCTLLENLQGNFFETFSNYCFHTSLGLVPWCFCFPFWLRPYLVYCCLQRCQSPLCWVTCSCSSWSSNWYGCTSSVSDSYHFSFMKQSLWTFLPARSTERKNF